MAENQKRFGENNPDMIETNISPWRRAVCGDLTSAFDFVNSNAAVPILPSTAAYLPPDANRYTTYRPTVPTVQTMPVQEPACARSGRCYIIAK